MAPTATLYVIIFTAIGVAAGWHFRRAQAANNDLKVHKGRIPGFRKVRARSGLLSVALLALALLALRALGGH